MILTHKSVHTLGLLAVLVVAAYVNIKFYDKYSKTASPDQRGQVKDFYNVIRFAIAAAGILVVLDYFFGPFGTK